MPYTQTLGMSADDQHRLLDWWNATESGKVIVRHLVSLVSELRLNPESSHADGMVLFYRAVSEISYGYAGIRGCIRRAFSGEYSNVLRKNMVMCHSFAHKYSVDAKVLLERVAKQITGENALQLISRIRETLRKNDEMLIEIANKARDFFGKGALQSLQNEVKHSSIIPTQ
ncbi:hypothetical protein D1B31_06785 [Neobacillus notoginsengisoli]|uniref:Uncharacterized protein n=1 Tax=Neobacillus notoginsengisoli TaxID=1578198 RepID=A0A417YVK1_9BACI|nr:hypothetical protein [Neobacillus notoginsengisoli]RHW41429.1 hypothetical protein D1B31_06785 [Neobacillus notoginsengisoli]